MSKRRALLISALLVGGLAASAGVWWWRDLVRDLPDESAVRRIGDSAQSTIVFDASDQPASALFTEERIDVPLDHVSSHFIRALIAIEDQRFYFHGPIDLPRIASAAFSNVIRGRAAQGASTLTQQLARAALLTPRKTLRRKLQEVMLAARIERRYSKPQILELYANRVYFGNGLWGVEAASLGYFGTHASDLTLPQAALLAGLVKSPTNYAPTTDLGKATRRRDQVLRAMFESGAIDRRTWEDARHSRVTLRDALSHRNPHGEYFFEEVRKDLVQRFGSDRVYQSGLRVYSTIDSGMQAAAETAVAASLRSLDLRRSRKATEPRGDALQAALIAIDPQTGAVRALVGGRDFTASRFDRAVQAYRQPGSAFKPFVYAAALESGYTQVSVIDHLDEPVATPQGAWLPDDGHVDADRLDLRNALRVSSNRAAIRLAQQVGILQVVRYASAFGLNRLPAVPSLALGAGEVTLASLTSAYAAFANGGIVRQPTLVRRVEDGRGHVLMTAPDTASRAMSEATAFLMSDMLQDVINAGTASQARRLGFTLPAAGKTGTTNGFNDAWFIGYTPHLVVGVWVGFDAPRTIMANGFAANVAVPLWAQFMSAATRDAAPDWFTPPPGVVGVEICKASGQVAIAECPEHRRQYFASGTQATQSCDLHRPSLNRKVFEFASIKLPQRTPTETATAASSSESEPSRAPEGPAKKPGFWSRLLHPRSSSR